MNAVFLCMKLFLAFTQSKRIQKATVLFYFIDISFIYLFIFTNCDTRLVKLYNVMYFLWWHWCIFVLPFNFHKGWHFWWPYLFLKNSLLIDAIIVTFILLKSPLDSKCLIKIVECGHYSFPLLLQKVVWVFGACQQKTKKNITHIIVQVSHRQQRQ